MRALHYSRKKYIMNGYELDILDLRMKAIASRGPAFAVVKTKCYLLITLVQTRLPKREGLVTVV